MSRRQREDEEEEHPYPQTAPRLAKCVNRGQGGAIAQLVSVSEKIRPDLELRSTNQSKRTKTPANAAVNVMAPSRLNNSGSLAQRDPPLSLATPTPSLMQGRPGSSFGFSPGGFVPPTDETMDTQGGVSQGDGIGGDLQDDREVPPAEVRTVNTPSYSYERRFNYVEPEESQSYTNQPVGNSTSAGHGHQGSRALRSDDGASDEDGGSQSVLQSHQQKNRAIRPPNPDVLLATDKRVPPQVPRQTNAGQLGTPTHDISVTCGHVANPRHNNRGCHSAPDNHGRHSLAPDENNAEGSNHDVAPKARSTRTFKPPEDAKPTHLRYYHGTPWYDVLVSAKSFYRMSIHTETSDPFPERSRESLGAAHDCLLEAIALLTTAEQASLNDTTYHVDHSNMTALIFDDGPSYRGRMKTMARDIVKSHFKAELNPSLTFGHNSSEQAQVISDAVRNTLQNSLFLVGPELDENIVNCLDEWESGYLVKVPFTGDAYGPRYSLIAGLADDVLGNAYHRKRLRARLRKIAADGWVSNSKKRGSNSSGHSFKVTLD
ncbi:hypothetical protein EDB89DRAFT_1911835 [Lactarius sanguifluus]|nr:hypothetical protein EDB89DRAFT_1911835 [Lactarius sanguifluus]